MKISGGYYMKARKIQESEIAFAPPHVREIWDWLIKEANHEDHGKIKRGQCVRTLGDIAEGLKWFVGYRKETYSKSKCEMATNWLRKRGMIRTTKTTRGLIITICNYEYYQDPKNYETNNENITKPTRNEQPSDTIYKNEKNVRNKNNIIDEKQDFSSNKKTENKKTIDQREKEFKLKIWELAKGTQFEDKETLREFFEYWSEHGENDRKMRFEKEKSFNILSRIKRWFKNKENFAAKQKNINLDGFDPKNINSQPNHWEDF